jgi:hypothetical protein
MRALARPGLHSGAFLSSTLRSLLTKGRGPQSVLAGFCALLLAVAAFYRGHSAESMDVRTYVQMIGGIADHGLPYWDNGPVDRFPELVVPWAVPSGGHLWGIYGPLYPYLAAPAFRLGGLAAVSSLTFALLVPLTVVTFLLARRVVENPWYATLAAVGVVVSTPITAKALEVTPFPLTALLATLGGYFTVRAIESPVRRYAFLAGLTWGAAGAAHALSFPMGAMALVVLAAAPDRGGRLSRFGLALLGFALSVAPLAYLNRLRFGSFNPVSYGPIPWRELPNDELFKMNLVSQVTYSMPAVLFVLAVGALACAARTRARGLVVALIALVVAFAVEPLRVRFLRYAVVGFGYLVDLGVQPLAPPYQRPVDGLGHVFGGWVVKSTLQCTPLLLLAPLALRGAGDKRWLFVAILAPCAALYASLTMRANLAYTDAFGWPWVYLRYTLAALPALLIASVLAVERVGLSRRQLGGAAVLGVMLLVALALTDDDQALGKRVVLLVMPLLAAGGAFVVGIRRETARWGGWVLAGALGLGMGIALGHDLRANVDTKVPNDKTVDRFAEVMPRRFALVGVLGQFDVVLTVAATRDVQYADAARLHRYDDLRRLLDLWRQEQRPIYFYTVNVEPFNPWPDITFTREPMTSLFRLHFRN